MMEKKNLVENVVFKSSINMEQNTANLFCNVFYKNNLAVSFSNHFIESKGFLEVCFTGQFNVFHERSFIKIYQIEHFTAKKTVNIYFNYLEKFIE